MGVSRGVGMFLIIMVLVGSFTFFAFWYLSDPSYIAHSYEDYSTDMGGLMHYLDASDLLLSFTIIGLLIFLLIRMKPQG